MIPCLCPPFLGLSGSENLQRISCWAERQCSAVRILANIYMHQAYGIATRCLLLAEPPCNCVWLGQQYEYLRIKLTLQSPVVTTCITSLTFNNSAFCPHTVFMCFVWIWEQTAFISLYSIWLVFFITEAVFTARYGLNLRVIYINPSKPSGHYMYHQFNIQKSYVLPTQCIYVFYMDLRTNSDYFPIHH